MDAYMGINGSFRVDDESGISVMDEIIILDSVINDEKEETKLVASLIKLNTNYYKIAFLNEYSVFPKLFRLKIELNYLL